MRATLAPCLVESIDVLPVVPALKIIRAESTATEWTDDGEDGSVSEREFSVECPCGYHQAGIRARDPRECPRCGADWEAAMEASVPDNDRQEIGTGSAKWVPKIGFRRARA